MGLIALALLPACGLGRSDSPAAQEDAIRGAVRTYLREARGINPDAMEMEILHLDIEGDRARAVVRFASADDPRRFEFEYVLSRAEGSWTVTGSTGRSPHGEAGELPEGHPPVPEAPPAAPDATDS